MIHFSFGLNWPRKSRWDRYDIFRRDFKVSENKNLEINFQFANGGSLPLIGAGLWVTMFQSHSGVMISLEFLGLCLEVDFNDRRHWNYEAGRWMTDHEMEHEFDK